MSTPDPHPVLGDLNRDYEFGPALIYLRSRGLRNVSVTWSTVGAAPADPPPEPAFGPPPAGPLLVWTARLTFGPDRRPVAAQSRPLRHHDGGARRALRAAMGLAGVVTTSPRKVLGRPPMPPEDVVELARRYREGATIRQLEAESPYSFGGIRGNLLRAGVRMRPRGRAARRS